MPRRSRARAVAFQILYRDDLNPTEDPAGDRALLESRLSSPELVEFAAAILSGVRARRAALDEAIQAAARNWDLHRMAATDRNVLRLGAFELLHMDTPDRVAVDEAVELAKRYGSAQSSSFVNGILDHLMHENSPPEVGGNDK
jgi:N utilization substance protein B